MGEAHGRGLQETLPILLDVAPHLPLSKLPSGGVLLQENPHLLDEETADDDVVVEPERKRLSVQLVGGSHLPVANCPHFFDEAAPNAPVLKIQCKQACFAVEHFVFYGLGDESLELCLRRHGPPLTQEVGLE